MIAISLTRLCGLRGGLTATGGDVCPASGSHRTPGLAGVKYRPSDRFGRNRGWKDLRAQAAQGGTIEVLRTLRPLVVVMAGAQEFDPYKD